jgi:Mrp family chromosome partitioning ATPase
MVPNAPDWLKSERMRDLNYTLRNGFDYIVMDTSPLLPVVDALVLATVADKVLVIVEWSRTPRDSIAEAFKVLRPEVHRVAGIVLNKADVHQFPGSGYGRYGGYNYRSAGKHAATHET